MGAAGRHSVCHHHGVDCCKSPFCHSQTPSATAPRFPSNSPGERLEWGPPKKRPTILGELDVSFGLFFHWRDHWLRAGLSLELCPPRGAGRTWAACSCSSYPSSAVSFSAVKGVLQPHPCILGFSQWCPVHEELLVLLLKGE